MFIKKSIAVFVVSIFLTSCSSRSWSCKSKYVNAKPVITEKKAV
jgi:hypothetical protein